MESLLLGSEFEREVVMAVRGFRATACAATALAAMVLLAGCTGSDGDKPGSGSTSNGGTPVATGGTASAYPVAPSVSASPMPVIGSRSNGDWSFDLNSVTQAGPGQVLVAGTLTSKGPASMTGFEEPGYLVHRLPDGKTESSYEFSAVTLTARGDTTV